MFFCLSIVAILAGCDKEEIKTYRVQKTVETAAPNDPGTGPEPGGAADPHAAVDPQAVADPHAGLDVAGAGPMASSVKVATFDAPPNWEAQALTSMREASFLVKGEGGATADVSLIVLRGVAGDTLANVNRWLSQLGQPAISAERLAEISQHLTAPLGDVVVVELEGLPPGADPSKDGKILAAIGSPQGDSWFFKLRGNAGLVSAEKSHFLDWVRSTHPTSSGGDSSAAAPQPAAPAEISAAPAPPAGGSAGKQIRWEVPQGWTAAAASGMRYASFAAKDAAGQVADVSVISLAGDGGSDLSNVNRWRQQVGLAEVAEQDLGSIVVRTGEMSVVDLAGTDRRMLAGWLRRADRTWFFKMVGPPALVGAEKVNFIAFLQSVQFGE